jgi:hypothetical protein
MHRVGRKIRDQLRGQIPELFPGIERVVVLYYDKSGKCGGEDLMQSGQGYRSHTLLADSMLSYLKELAGKAPGYLWLSPSQLPFETRTAGGGQLDIFAELSYTVLQLRIKSEDGLDLYYLFFRDDQSNLGISRNQSPLDTAQKALIGSLAYRFVRMLYDNNLEYKAFIVEFTELNQRIFGGKSKDNDPGIPAKWIESWANNRLKTASDECGISLQLSSDAVEKLSRVTDFETANRALEQAIRFTLMNAVVLSLNEAVVEAAYIRFDLPESPASSVKATELNPALSRNRVKKTASFLDKLEAAAYKILKSGDELTGSAVGRSMEKPISAPAITDAIRKNRENILQLLEQHPEKWQLIRSYFKPLTNILPESDSRKIG